MTFPRPDDRWVRWLLVPAIVFISQATNDAYLVDFWHHLARGREMVRLGDLLDHDVFTFTVPNKTFVDVNWLSQLVFYSLFSIGGLGLVRTVNALLLAGAWAWLVGICKRESRSLEIAMAIGLLTFLGAWQVLTIRPQTFSIVLFIGMYDVLLRSERNPRWLLVTPVFLAMWANMHGAFPAGLMLTGMFWAGRLMTLAFTWVRGGDDPMTRHALSDSAVIPFTFALIACAAATLVNPYGKEIYEYARATSGISARRGIDEWLPPSWDQGIGVAWFVSLPIVAFVLIVAWRRGRRVSWREAFLLMCFGFLAMRSIRMVLWWLNVIAPMLSVRLADLWPKSREVVYIPSRAATFTVLGLLAFCVLSLPPLHAFNPLLRLRSPNETTANLDAALEFLRSQKEKGNVFSKLEWGEYLGWKGYPDWKVFMDGRIEIYPDEVWDDYASFTRGELNGFVTLLDGGYGPIDYYVFDAPFHFGKGLLPGGKADEKDSAWTEVWRRGDVAVFKGQRIVVFP